jgi:hypothetical protein
MMQKEKIFAFVACVQQVSLCYIWRMEKTKAIKLAGSQVELAKLLGIRQPAVSAWKNVVPKARVWQLKVLRPDWFKDELR